MPGLYKLICIDLDGTLIGKPGNISDYNVNAIQKAKEEGAIVCIASGRPYGQIAHYAARCGLDTPVVACNGAHVYNPKTGEYWMKEDLPTEEAVKILKFCDERDIIWNMCTHFTFYSRYEDGSFPATRVFVKNDYSSRNTKDSPDAELYRKYGIPSPERVVVRTEEEYRSALDKGCGKISIFPKNEEERDIVESYYDTSRPGTVCKKAADFLEEIMSDKSSKWGAIQLLADKLGVPHEQICVFGDNMNDMDMIRECRTSFAMGNGDERIFPHATHVVRSNFDDGVGHGIEDFILGNIIK